MDIPITVCLSECNFDKAVKVAVYESGKAVAEYDADVMIVRRDKTKITDCYDIKFVGMFVSVDLKGETEYIYSFKINKQEKF